MTPINLKFYGRKTRVIKEKRLYRLQPLFFFLINLYIRTSKMIIKKLFSLNGIIKHRYKQ